MSKTETIKQPDPTFLKDDNIDLRKPLGLAIEQRQQVLQDEPTKQRLSRKEFEALLDGYYAIGDGDAKECPAVLPPTNNRAPMAGGQLARNLVLASTLALFLGAGAGLYALSQPTGQTRVSQIFNQSLAGFWKTVQAPAIGQKTGATGPGASNSKQAAAPVIKPIRTASLVVADASGTIQAGIPLKLSLNAGSDTSLLQVKIINVPGDAVLTAGIRRSDGVWILQPADLKNVSLVVSSDRKTPLRLDIELIEARTGELLSPTREIKVAIIQPEPFTVGGL